ncbi:MAG: Ig-like domain-containing protein [Bacteroidales bacterium]
MLHKIKYLVWGLLFIFISINGYGQAPDFTGLKVMINPGHGGHDSDDRGMPNGFWESEGNLTKGLWLRDLLESRGCEVIMSRELNRTEDDLPLSTIAAMANDNNVDLFISIHSNGGNQVSNYPMTIFNGKSDDPAIPEAKVWAQILWEQLITNEATFWTNTSPHFIGDLTLNPGWTYGYGVLYPLEVPGIISEGSFHDYRPEMDRLLNLDYRRQEAWNMLLAMETYFNLPGTEDFGNISGIIRDSLLAKDNYSIANSPDKYMNVNGAVVELVETGDIYQVDLVNTGFYMFDSIPPGSYNLVFSATDYFNDTVQIEVIPHQFSFHNPWMKADKTMAPRVISTTPHDGDTINCFDPVRITFNMNMDSLTVAQAFNISPNIPGSFSWDKDYLNVYFQPDIPFDTLTEYTVTLNNTAEHQWGVAMDSAVSLSFITGDRNRYTLLASFPSISQQEVSPYLQFRLIFDAPLNNTSLINSVEIIPKEGTTLGTKGATISSIDGTGHYYFSPSTDLQYNSTYTLKIHGSVMDEKNIPLVDSVEIPFTTMEEPVNLVIIDEFDQNNGWIIDFDSSTGIDGSSFLYRWTKTMRSGESSTLLRYNFLDPVAACVIKPASESVGLIENSNMIGIWIWGDLSYNRIDAGFNNQSVAELCTIDFAGWNYCTVSLPEGVSSLDYLKIVKTDEGNTGGDIYFDALNQRDLTSVFTGRADGKVTVYPNPLTGDKIHLSNLDGNESRYELYSISGQFLQQGNLKLNNPVIQLERQAQSGNTLILRIINDTECQTILIINNQQ